jgi:hypothetical protein
MSRRTLILIAVPAALLAVFAIRQLTREPPGDEEQIRALFTGAALAAEEKKVGDVVEAVSERFSGGGLDKRGVKGFLLGMVLRGDWVSVSIAGLSVAVDGDRARANVDVVTARSGKGKAVADLIPQEGAAHRIACRLEREGSDWRVVGAEWTQITLAEALAGPPPP